MSRRLPLSLEKTWVPCSLGSWKNPLESWWLGWISFSLTNFLTLPEKIAGVVSWGYYFLVVVLIAWVISDLSGVLLRHFVLPWIEKTGNDLAKSIFNPFQSALRFFIWFIAIVVGLDSAGYDIGAVLAGLGIGGLAVAMAARETISDLLGGVSLILTRPFKPGDLVEVKGRWMKVLAIGIRVSFMEDFANNAKVTVPNSYFMNNEIVNFSGHPGSMILMNLRLSLSTPPDKLEYALEKIAEIIDKHERTRFIWIKLNHFDEHACTIRMHYDILSFKERNKVKTDINVAIFRLLHENGIRFSELPVRNVEIAA